MDFKQQPIRRTNHHDSDSSCRDIQASHDMIRTTREQYLHQEAYYSCSTGILGPYQHYFPEVPEELTTSMTKIRPHSVLLLHRTQSQWRSVPRSGRLSLVQRQNRGQFLCITCAQVAIADHNSYTPPEALFQSPTQAMAFENGACPLCVFRTPHPQKTSFIRNNPM